MTLANRGKLDQAIPFLAQAADLAPTAQTLSTLVKALLNTNEFEKALLCIDKMERMGLATTESLYWKSLAQSSLGLLSESIKTLRQVLSHNPNDVGILRHYCNLIWSENPEEVIERLTSLTETFTDDIPNILDGLHHAMHYVERWEKVKKGLSPVHATALDDLYGAHAPDQRAKLFALANRKLERDPNDVDALSMLGFYHVGLQDWPKVASYTERLRAVDPKHPNLELWIDDECAGRLDAMTDADIVAPFAPVHDIIKLEPSTEGTLFLSSDRTYFRHFAAPLLLSLDSLGVPLRAQAHIMNADEKQLPKVKAFVESLQNVKCGVSVEYNDFSSTPALDRRNYYAAIRYVRLYQAMMSTNGPFCSVDVDGLINATPDRVYQVLEASDVGFCFVPGVWFSRAQVRGDFFAIANSPGGRAFAQRVAARISDSYRRDKLYWCLDQNSLYTVYLDMLRRNTAPSLHVFDEAFYTLDAKPDVVYWSSAGKQKFEDLLNIGQDQTDDPNRQRSPYMAAFEPYYRTVRDMLF